ncbi:MAG TPA: CHASE3 domain-containing protein [Verrucomicrobiae bacterium]|nr:CHASE3 domain-containing protein [Verrucomicrobiae bacterium]
MTRRFESKIRRGFVAVAIILVFVVILAIGNSRQFRRAIEETNRSQETLRALEEVLITMVDAETGMRGFIISGDERFLQPYNRALATIEARMKQLKALIDETGIDGRFDELRKAVDTQIAFRRAIIQKLKANPRSEELRASIRIDEGKRGMDEVRRIVAAMERDQEEALVSRKERAEITDLRATVALITFVALTVGMLVEGVKLLHKHLIMREKLEAERNRFFTLSPDMYFVAGTDGYFKEANPAAQRILGYTAEELRSKPFIDFVHPDDREATMAESARVNSGQRTVYFENRYLTKDGTYRWMLWSSAPVLEENLIYAVARDITEHKKIEERMTALAEETKQHAAELEAVNKELEAFSYSVSHDLRAPLRHIAGFSDMLQRHADGSLDDKGKRYLNTIVESAKRMGTLIDDLLVFSRMGRSELHREKIDLNKMVDEVIAELGPDVGGRQVNWKKHKLPQVVGDRAMLKQVLVNLLSNALKYSGTREVANIEINFREETDEFVFCVKDNGVGFDMAYANKLFGVFQRLHDASQFEGTGIGLANVRRIVSRHGGRTWAEAELDKGAAFYFSLPKAKVHAAPPAA